MKSTRKALAVSLGAALALAACGSDEPEDNAEEGGPVTLEVMIDEGLEPNAIEAINDRVKVFEDANPDITIETREYTWTGPTFAADLAGGTLPDVFRIPFTDGRGLIANEQIADISDLVAELPYADKFNPTVAEAGQDADGNMWAIPTGAYGQGLHYNRALFTAAGLDPDDPPSSWEEIRAAAKQIAEKTGQAGYATMTQGNTGGWILTTLVYAYGGRMIEVDGDEKTATVDTPQTREVLDFLKQMRWEDNSMGANFLYDWAGINQDFGAGAIGMYVSGGGNYGQLVTQNGMNPDDYGVTVLPLEGSDGAALGGGTLAAVNAKATEAEKAAAVKWIDFFFMNKLFDEEAAIADAEIATAQNQPVGIPELPVFDQETYEQTRTWIADYINVPVEQIAPYTDAVFDQPLVAEPQVATQEIYAALDPVVQALLTDQNADIDTLLTDAQAAVQGILDKS